MEKDNKTETFFEVNDKGGLKTVKQLLRITIIMK